VAPIQLQPSPESLSLLKPLDSSSPDPLPGLQVQTYPRIQIVVAALSLVSYTFSTLALFVCYLPSLPMSHLALELAVALFSFPSSSPK
jgi:hypothetical protein